jgi:hypothetical protein
MIMEFKKYDSGKLEWDLLPENALNEVMKVIQYGKSKYGSHNWIENSEGVEWTRYSNALERHLKKFKSGIDYDEESNLYELAHVITNALFLLTYQIEELGNDNRDFRIGKEFNGVRCLRYIREGNDKSTKYYEFSCPHCGAIFTAIYNNVQKGNTTSCGCLGNNHYKTHGMASHPIYNRWRGILTRCYDENAISYPNYGAKGIGVCERWHKFENFLEDMGKIPEGNFTIERKDNFKNYEPNNCEWVHVSQQAKNRGSFNKVFVYNGETKILKDWARCLGINYSTMHKRIYRGGLRFEDAIKYSQYLNEINPETGGRKRIG